MESNELFEIRTRGGSARWFAGYETWDVIGTFPTYDEAMDFAYRMSRASGYVILYCLTTNFNNYSQLVC